MRLLRWTENPEEPDRYRLVPQIIRKRGHRWKQRKFTTTKPNLGVLNKRYHQGSSKPNRLRVSVSL